MARRDGRIFGLGGALLALTIGLAACGFEPVYTRQSTDQGAMSPKADLYATEIALIADRRGQILHNLLLDRFNPNGRPRNPLYTLDTDVGVTVRNLGLQTDATTTRSEVKVRATATLTGVGEPQTFFAVATSSFNTTESDYGTLVAEDEAVERAMRTIAEQLTVQVSAFFRKARSQG